MGKYDIKLKGEVIVEVKNSPENYYNKIFSESEELLKNGFKGLNIELEKAKRLSQKAAVSK
jgi:hypothetical protein